MPDNFSTVVHAVKAAQAVLSVHIEPDSPHDAGATVDALLGILDHQEVARALEALEPPEATGAGLSRP